MTMNPDAQFELRQISGNEWIIRDHRYDAHDERSAVARIWWVGDDVCEVDWLADFALPTRYVSPANAIEHLRRAVSRSTKPIPIPHFAPLGARSTLD